MTAGEVVNSHTPEFEKVIQHLKSELSGLRTGRASTGLVESIPVQAYGATQALRDMAQITVPEPKQILIQPWDKSVISDIEKAIQMSPLGVNPMSDGSVIRITLPPLTEERRKDLTKIVGQYAETARISIRNVRESVLKELKRLEEADDISEDERFRAEANLQKKIDELNKEVKEIAEAKEKEIMTV